MGLFFCAFFAQGFGLGVLHLFAYERPGLFAPLLTKTWAFGELWGVLERPWSLSVGIFPRIPTALNRDSTRGYDNIL